MILSAAPSSELLRSNVPAKNSTMRSAFSRTIFLLPSVTPLSIDPLPVTNQNRLCDLLYSADSGQDQHPFNLLCEDIDNALHSLNTRCSYAPGYRASDKDGFGAEGQRLHDIPAAPDAAVEQHRHFAPYGCDYFRQRFDRGAIEIEYPAAVV